MQNYSELKSNEPQFLAITGFKLATFDICVPYFRSCWDDYISRYTVSGKVRRRPKKYRKDDIFPDIETMLIFILSYMKNNPLQQTHASAFGMTKPQCNVWIHFLTKILSATLEKVNCLPCRDIESLNKLLQNGQNILIDGTERPIQCHKKQDKQQNFYSGKKTPYDKKFNN